MVGLGRAIWKSTIQVIQDDYIIAFMWLLFFITPALYFINFNFYSLQDNGKSKTATDKQDITIYTADDKMATDKQDITRYIADDKTAMDEQDMTNGT